MVWSGSRLLLALALAVWAALFWFIMLADRTSFYFATRTDWLAPVGAVFLTLAALGRVAFARTPRPDPPSASHVRAMVLLLAPALLILLFPPVTLGSYAVAKRSTSIKGAYVSVTGRDLSTGDLSLVDIFGLRYTGDLGRLASRAGSTSSFTGFVSREPSNSADEFMLNRFMISCCPGDAVNVQVRVVGAPPGQFAEDDWVRVTGRIYPIGEDVIVDASEVQPVDRPKHPYLNPS
jgi:uncharacterized repeat protein (TIGR03943 family)